MAEVEKEDDSTDKFLLFVLTFLCMPFGIVLWGWVLQSSWNWFTPVIDARIPHVTLVQAVAARAVFGIFVGHLASLAPKKSAKEQVSGTLVMTFIAPFIVLFFQWLLHLVVHV